MATSPSETDDYVAIRRDDIPGSVRRLVEECLLKGMTRCEQKLDSMSFEAQNRVADLVNTYRSLMVDALIQMFKTKDVITAEDVRRIHELIQKELF